MPHSAACKTGVMTNRPQHFQVYSHLLYVELQSIHLGCILKAEAGSKALPSPTTDHWGLRETM